jgi:malate synthase
MSSRDIPYYKDFLSDSYLEYLLKQSTPVSGVDCLLEVGKGSGLETKKSLQFLIDLYKKTKDELNLVLSKRIEDRKFIDERVKATYQYNKSENINYLSHKYKTILGLEDSNGQVIMGPLSEKYCRQENQKPIAPIPEYLKGIHVTLFGPPSTEKMCINAMNTFHRKINNEPEIIAELLAKFNGRPMWGADDEDSKTPLRSDLIEAGKNLSQCFTESFDYLDPKTKKTYKLKDSKLSLPLKRFPGLALPSMFLFYNSNPIPLHLYDFALHLFKNWERPESLVFYVPKLENELEARYIKNMIETSEQMIQDIHPEYQLGTIRVMVVLENPRAIFRAHEMMDELYPYFVGASLGWHDFLASTARVFKEDSNYRIPVKADPDIVIKYIQASHNLLADVVGSRGGIKVGGMYGVLPIDNNIESESFQITMRGYFRDVIIQLKRDLTGFWVAHPDFVRIGIAIVEAWKIFKKGDSSYIETLICSILVKKYQDEMIDFTHAEDIEGLNTNDPMFARSLIVADVKESDFMANNDPQEIRYNIFQSLQYLTDWLCGNGCVALPHHINGTPVRVMDDLATAERSRWEVWHELYHNRFSLEDFIRISHEEMHFIRKDHSNDKKIVQVKFDQRTSKWYPVAFKLMIQLMGNKNPVEFASQLLLPFTNEKIRLSNDPWEYASLVDPDKFKIDPYLNRFNYYFEMCGSIDFAHSMALNPVLNIKDVQKNILNFTLDQVISASSFHGNIGENKKGLDKLASDEQKLVSQDGQDVKNELLELGSQYLKNHSIKFLISAKGKTSSEIKKILLSRMDNSNHQELENAKEALWEITRKRIIEDPIDKLNIDINSLLEKHNIIGATVSVVENNQDIQTLNFGYAKKNIKEVDSNTYFQIASLSKSVATAFSIEYFKEKDIDLNTSVNQLLEKLGVEFRLKKSSSTQDDSFSAEDVKIKHLMNHSGLNLHYVNGVEANKLMPPISDFLNGDSQYDYPPIEVINNPGKIFKYSGAGFIVLEYLIESLEKKPIKEITKKFFKELNMDQFTFDQHSNNSDIFSNAYLNGKGIEAERKMFPAFAAGAMSTSNSMQKFLTAMAKAYKDINIEGPISHDTAVLMLEGKDRGCKKFMNCLMGLGIFTIDCGPNQFMLHQGANDGFRTIFLHCYHGPDFGKGVSIFCNGDLEGVFFNASVCQLILDHLNLKGIDKSMFKENFELSNLTQEEIVNIGYKELLLNAFSEKLPEEIIRNNNIDPLSKYNLVKDAEIIEVSNQKFALAENLINPNVPTFDPALFGSQGKVMDSWESARHSEEGFEYLILKLCKPAKITHLSLCTKYHFGNQVQSVTLLGLNQNNMWDEILVKSELEGHSIKRVYLSQQSNFYKQLKVITYPDGGLTRLGIYEGLPESEAKLFDNKSYPYNEKIPEINKPLSMSFENNSNLKFISASNEHYAPAKSILSSYSPLNMFDGFESSRSRIEGNFEEIILEFKKPQKIKTIEIDFTYFINNNPNEMQFLGLVNDEWKMLTEKVNVKAFAGNEKRFLVFKDDIFEQLKIIIYPDGGFNRIRVN